MRYKTYRHKYQRIKYMIDLALKCLIVGFLIGIWIAILTPVAEADFISPVAPSVSSESSFSTGQETEGDKPTFSQFKDYARQIFGNKWRLAVAVSECECNHTRKEFPYCINSWGENGRGEHSVGSWQINLAKDGGKGAWVHAGKIPGQTIGEKETWLMDYRHNTMMAYVISKGGTDFSPWTGYTSQCYLTKMNGL